jgi:hypothetical protein
LDAESVDVLKSMIKTPATTNGKSYVESSNVTDSKYDRNRN